MVFIIVNSDIINDYYSESEDILLKPSPFPCLI